MTTLFCVSVPVDPYSSCLLITSDHWVTTLFCVCVPAEPYFSYPLTDQHVDVGSRLSWHCEARGKPPPTYTWYKDGQPLRNSSGDHWVWGLFCWAWVIKVDCCSVSQQNAWRGWPGVCSCALRNAFRRLRGLHVWTLFITPQHGRWVIVLLVVMMAGYFSALTRTRCLLCTGSFVGDFISSTLVVIETRFSWTVSGIYLSLAFLSCPFFLYIFKIIIIHL